MEWIKKVHKRDVPQLWKISRSTTSLMIECCQGHAWEYITKLVGVLPRHNGQQLLGGRSTAISWTGEMMLGKTHTHTHTHERERETEQVLSPGRDSVIATWFVGHLDCMGNFQQLFSVAVLFWLFRNKAQNFCKVFTVVVVVSGLKHWHNQWKTSFFTQQDCHLSHCKFYKGGGKFWKKMLNWKKTA